MKDISREELKEWINKNAFDVADVLNKSVGIGFHPFLYPKQSEGNLLIMKYNKDKEDQILGTIPLPPGTYKYSASKDILSTKIKAIRDWWQPHVVYGRRFHQKQTKPYPTGPEEKDTLFYVVQDNKTKTFLTYPGTSAIRIFHTRPEADAARELASRNNGRYHMVIRIVKEPTKEFDELTLQENLMLNNGWYYGSRPATT